MVKNDRISERQLDVLTFTALLSPLIRLLPRAAVDSAGKAAWLSPGAAALFGVLFLLFMKAFFKNRRDGEGMYEMTLRAIGRPCGKAVAFVFALWLIFYSGFMLRTAAERFLSAIYTTGNTPIFVIITLAASLLAAMGAVKSLARAAEVFALIIVAVFVMVLLFSVSELKTLYLLPVSFSDAAGIFRGALPITDVICGYAYATFLFKYVPKTPGEGRRPFGWMLLQMGFAVCVMVTTIGSCSAELLVKLQNPFFMMIRNITVLGFVERIESIVIAVWVSTDFLLLGFAFIIIGEILRGVFDARDRRPFVIPAGALAAVCAFVMASNAFDLRFFSEKLIPTVNIASAVGLLPVIFVIGKLRKTV